MRFLTKHWFTGLLILLCIPLGLWGLHNSKELSQAEYRVDELSRRLYMAESDYKNLRARNEVLERNLENTEDRLYRLESDNKNLIQRCRGNAESSYVPNVQIPARELWSMDAGRSNNK